MLCLYCSQQQAPGKYSQPDIKCYEVWTAVDSNIFFNNVAYIFLAYCSHGC